MEFINTFKEMTVGELMISLALIGSGIKVSWDLIKKIKGGFEILHNRKNKLDKKDETIQSHTEQLQSLAKKYEEHSKKSSSKSDEIIRIISENQKENRELIDHIRKAMIEHMSSDITKSCELYLERGSIEVYELAALVNQFNAYHEIGGNHGVHELVEKVKKLDVKYIHRNS